MMLFGGIDGGKVDVVGEAEVAEAVISGSGDVGAIPPLEDADVKPVVKVCGGLVE